MFCACLSHCVSLYLSFFSLLLPCSLYWVSLSGVYNLKNTRFLFVSFTFSVCVSFASFAFSVVFNSTGAERGSSLVKVRRPQSSYPLLPTVALRRYKMPRLRQLPHVAPRGFYVLPIIRPRRCRLTSHWHCFLYPSVTPDAPFRFPSYNP